MAARMSFLPNLLRRVRRNRASRRKGERAQIALEFETARPVVHQIEIEVTTRRASRNLQQAFKTQRTFGWVNAEQGNADLDLSTEAE